MSEFDPYAATTYHSSVSRAETLGDFQPITHLDLVRLVKSPFVSPNWIVNLVWMLICEFLSFFVIGNIIYLGYAGEVAVARSGGRADQWPDFQIDRFGEYFIRGLWPFLWQLIGGVAALVVLGVPVLCTVFGAITLADQEMPGGALAVGIIGGIASLLLAFFFSIVMVAINLKSVLANDFMAGGELQFWRAYVTNVSLTTLLAFLYLWLLSILYMLCGLLLFCVGVMLVSPMLRLVMCDLLAQLHDIHMSYGGPPAFPMPGSDDYAVEAEIVG
ncbi:MAG: DUF4013 domain-containing protein [Planctomycetes bacterium]|nr:DUF4013 domain-containing protein [Planctomycetota bacterium]